MQILKYQKKFKNYPRISAIVATWTTIFTLFPLSIARAASFKPLDVPSGGSFIHLGGDRAQVLIRNNFPGGTFTSLWDEFDGIRSVGGFGSRSQFVSAISDDGTKVIGTGTGPGQPLLGYLVDLRNGSGYSVPGSIGVAQSQVYDLSADGSKVVGSYLYYPYSPGGISPQTAFIWDTVSGVKPLGYLPGASTSVANTISGNGTKVLGRSGANYFLWDNLNGMQVFDADIAPSNFSFDGSTIVGRSNDRAALWDNVNGVRQLGLLPGAISSQAYDISDDLTKVIGVNDFGNSQFKSFLWEKDRGMRLLKDVFTSDYGLDLTGWNLTQVSGISGDGLTIAGTGINPQGKSQGWIARLKTAIPESTNTLGIIGIVGLALLFQQSERR